MPVRAPLSRRWSLAVGGDVIVRPAHKDHHNELSMALMNTEISGLPTEFLVADTTTGWVSSTFVRNATASGSVNEACAVVPPAVGAAIRNRPRGNTCSDAPTLP